MLGTGDVYADLLKIAESKFARPMKKDECKVGMPVVHNQFGPGEVADLLPQFKFNDIISVRFADGEAKQVSARDLTKPAKAPPAPKPAAILAPAVAASLQEFVAYLRKTGYKLYVILRQLDERQRVASEYSEWTGGETLPDSAIKDYSGTGGTFQREWVLTTRYDDNMPCHIPIEEGGSIGKGRGHLMGPHGVRQGTMVQFSSPETVAEVLQAGLRPK